VVTKHITGRNHYMLLYSDRMIKENVLWECTLIRTFYFLSVQPRNTHVLLQTFEIHCQMGLNSCLLSYTFLRKRHALPLDLNCLFWSPNMGQLFSFFVSRLTVTLKKAPPIGSVSILSYLALPVLWLANLAVLILFLALHNPAPSQTSVQPWMCKR
jgi:hypothetical protein